MFTPLFSNDIWQIMWTLFKPRYDIFRLNEANWSFKKALIAEQSKYMLYALKRSNDIRLSRYNINRVLNFKNHCSILSSSRPTVNFVGKFYRNAWLHLTRVHSQHPAALSTGFTHWFTRVGGVNRIPLINMRSSHRIHFIIISLNCTLSWDCLRGNEGHRRNAPSENVYICTALISWMINYFRLIINWIT